MSKWFNSKKNEIIKPDNSLSPPGEQTQAKLDLLTEKIDGLSKTVNVLEDKLTRLMESNKLLLEYYSTRDQRDVNYMIRSYNLKNSENPPINFVASKSANI